MRQRDIYWIAALLEGEGCFTIQKAHGKLSTPLISLIMCDLDVLERAHRLLRVTAKITRHNALNPKWKSSFGFHLTGTPAIAWMMTVYPIMGQRRQARIREILAWWKRRPVHPYKRKAA